MCENPQFHNKLLASLDDVIDQLTQLTTNAESCSGIAADKEFLQGGLWEAKDNNVFTMAGLQTFVTSLEEEANNIDSEIGIVEEERQKLSEERDVLIEKGHELNCRIGYNALERKLEESFTSIEKFTSEESARCFRDEAEERLKRSRDLIRVANMRTCQVDRDLFNIMEDITGLFQTYEKDRSLYVKELDLFTDVRRARIDEWLAAEPRSDELRERAEAILDLMDLQEKRRHLESQVIMNALRMYSFNASLTFDQDDNQKMMDELLSIQTKVNLKSGSNSVLLRGTTAKTDLTKGEEVPSGHEDDFSIDEVGEKHGRGLHKCPRQMSLMSEPVTEPGLWEKLEENLRWPEGGGTGSTALTDDKQNGGSADPSPVQCKEMGDAETLAVTPMDDSYPLKAPVSEIQQGGRSVSTAVRNVESHPILPVTAKRQVSGTIRRKAMALARPAGSLTNVHLDGDRSTEFVPGEVTRSQGSEPSLRVSSIRGKEWPPE